MLLDVCSGRMMRSSSWPWRKPQKWRYSSSGTGTLTTRSLDGDTTGGTEISAGRRQHAIGIWRHAHRAWQFLLPDLFESLTCASATVETLRM